MHNNKSLIPLKEMHKLNYIAMAQSPFLSHRNEETNSVSDYDWEFQ